MDRARHQLLAGARFADDEDVAARRGGELHQAVQRLHLVAGADEFLPAFRNFIAQEAIFAVQNA